jgi:hypothetical protein
LGCWTVQSFYDIVINMGLAERLKAMIDDVERSIVAYPDGPDQRYLARLENQLERLRHPDLRLLVALSTQMCVDHPDRAGDVAARLGELLPAHPYLTGAVRDFERSAGLTAQG